MTIHLNSAQKVPLKLFQSYINQRVQAKFCMLL